MDVSGSLENLDNISVILRTKKYDTDTSLKPGLHISRKDRKHRHVFQAVQLWLGLHVVVTIVNIDLSQEIFAIDMLRALKSSLKHRRKHVLRPLQLYGDKTLVFHLVQALGIVIKRLH